MLFRGYQLLQRRYVFEIIARLVDGRLEDERFISQIRMIQDAAKAF